jgi:hypothetical protein
VEAASGLAVIEAVVGALESAAEEAVASALAVESLRVVAEDAAAFSFSFFLS